MLLNVIITVNVREIYCVVLMAVDVFVLNQWRSVL